MAATILGAVLLFLGMAGTLLAPQPQQDTTPAALWRDAGLLLASWGSLAEAAVLLLTHPGDGACGPLTAVTLGLLAAGAVVPWWPHTTP